MTTGRIAFDRLQQLARYSDEPNAITRLFLSQAHKAAVVDVRYWMEQAGMAAGMDAAGSVVGRYEGDQPGLPALLLGSHIDSVRNAGRYDGTLGVILAITAVEALALRGERLPFAVEVLAFGDEEGVRFPTTLLGSRAVAGGFDPAVLESKDERGVSLRWALQLFGCDAGRIPALARRRKDVLAYVETHIEQGPVLEAEALPLGVVTAISGASRFVLDVRGVAGHAGTVPMRLRQDALAAAAEMVLAIEGRARATAELVATVGQIEIPRGAVNTVPGRVTFTLDIRAPEDAVRAAAIEALRADLDAIAARRGVELSIAPTYEQPAVRCDPGLVRALARAVERQGIRPRLLPSGAGHDGLAMVELCPVGMLFVRCKGGISHNPAESITIGDMSKALDVLLDFLRGFEPEPFKVAA